MAEMLLIAQTAIPLFYVRLDYDSYTRSQAQFHIPVPYLFYYLMHYMQVSK